MEPFQLPSAVICCLSCWAFALLILGAVFAVRKVWRQWMAVDTVLLD